jgi:hypothetical protein
MNNIKVTVSGLHKVDKQIKAMFFNILKDYCARFNVHPTSKTIKVMISFIHYPENSKESGLVIYENEEDSNRILVQIRDPMINDWELNPFAMNKFINIICHEFVHVCQRLTNRKGSRIPGLKYNKLDDLEGYMFSPDEVEARALEAPYTAMYGAALYE